MSAVMKEWPTWFRWTIRILALVIIAIGGTILYMAAPINSAGNTGIEFIAQVEGFRGGQEEAYDRLCSTEQDRIGRDQFLESGGAEYAVFAHAGAVGAAAKYPDDTETLSGEVQQAWVEYEITTTGGDQTWRLNLARERDWWEFKGDWKICGLEQRE